MRFTLIIVILALVLLPALPQSQNVQAQHGDGDMTFEVYVFDHDIEITQIDEERLHIVEKITCYNPSENESYTDTITCWAQEGSEVYRFGPLVNDSYEGGNYSRLSAVIVQYNLGDNGYEIPANGTFQILFEYDLEFTSDTYYYGKTFYYTNYFTVVTVYTLPDTEIATTDIHMDFNEQGLYYITHDSDTRTLGDTFSILFRPKEDPSESSTFFLILGVIAIIAIIIIVHQVYTNNSDLQRALAKTMGKTGSNTTTSAKSDTRKKSSSGKKNTQHSNQSKTDRPLEDMDTLLEKKKNLLAAIKRLDDDHDSGLLSDDIYSELKEEYKLKAVDVLKRIDGQNWN